MSPEQASADREPTRASDVYSLACVLYEMLVGEPPYTGGSAQAVLARILTEDPAPSRSKRPSVPAHVDAAIRKALERLPADRFASAEDFTRALADPGFRHGADVTGAAGVGPWRRRAIAASVAAVALALTTALAVAWGASRAPEAREPVRSYLLLPPDVRPAVFSAPAFSPDGTLLVSGVAGGRPAIFRRGRGELDFTLVSGTEGGQAPTISPDGRVMAFRTPSGIARVSLAGGPVTEVVAGADPLGMAWGDDSSLYYPPSYNQGIWRVSDDVPTPVQVTSPDLAAEELGHWWPQLLPDGEHLLFTAYRSPADSSRIRVVSLRTGDVTTVLRAGFSARYTPSGHLVFARGSALYAIMLDVDALVTSGPVELVADGVAVEPQSGRAHYGLSDSGTLVYATAGDVLPPSRIVLVERATGEETELPPPPDVYQAPALSPDGRTLVLTVRRPGTARDVVTFDLGSVGRFQYLAQAATDEFAPLWTPDGERVVYVCEDRAFDLCWRAPNSGEPVRKLWTSGHDKIPSSFTPDGERLVFEERAEEIRFLALSLANPELPPDTLLTFADIRPTSPRLSPDGRWMTYVTLEAASEGVWVESLDSLRSRLRIAPAGASSPRWTKGGREIVYRGGSEDPGVFAVPIDPVTGRPGAAERLFEDVYDASMGDSWHVSPDGERFIMVKPLENAGAGRLVMVEDFFTELERLLPN
jgi:serine/threonine-protein kinase